MTMRTHSFHASSLLNVRHSECLFTVAPGARDLALPAASVEAANLNVPKDYS
jgi:hypothetical protein